MSVCARCVLHLCHHTIARMFSFRRGRTECCCLNNVVQHAWWESNAVHCPDATSSQISIKRLVRICRPVVTGPLFFVSKSVSGVPLFREQSN